MGIDAHALHLLTHAHRKYGAFGRVVTLGRQAIHLGPADTRQWSNPRDVYCETLLSQHFGASTVDSIDNSSYEQASLVADMNHPVPASLVGAFDTVIDFGCLEHIFDVAQSIRNVADMCSPGGRILHLLPANGFCGHGFYQFSPELFFSSYSPKNGYQDTELYFADLLDSRHWYRITAPANGERINIRSSHEIYLVVLARHMASRSNVVQQSDYEYAWTEPSSNSPTVRRFGLLANVRESALRFNLAARIVRAMDSRFTTRVPYTLRRHPSLTRVSAGRP